MYNKNLNIFVEYRQTQRGWEVQVRQRFGQWITHSVHDDEDDAQYEWMKIGLGERTQQDIIDSCRVHNATHNVIDAVMA